MNKDQEIKEKIIFTLNTNISEKLSASYKGRIVSVGVDIVPENMKNPYLLYEERIINAENYLKCLLLN